MAAIATAPALGAAALTISAVTLDRIGLQLDGLGVSLAASAVAGLGGVASFFVLARNADS